MRFVEPESRHASGERSAIRRGLGSRREHRVEEVSDSGEGGHAREASVGERRAVEAFGRRLPVEQTMTTIRTRLLTDESEPDAIVAAVAKLPNGYRAISYTYENTPRIGLRRKSPPHRGGALLTIHGEPPNRIVGEYWTARDSQGELTLTSRSPDVAQSFEEAHSLTF